MAALPDISIILLTWNAMPGLAPLLAAIFGQRTSRTCEVLTIDSGSTDGTLELLSDYAVRVKQISLKEFNFGVTRGLGYDLARGEILITLSQDALPADECWLEKMAAPFDNPTVAAVRGGQDLPRKGPLFYWERIGRFYFTRSTNRWEKRYGFTFSNVNSAVRKAVWEQNRIGPVEMSEDMFLQKKWTEAKLRIVQAPEAKVYHAHNYDLTGLIQRCQNEGLGARLCGECYSFWDACCDALNLENWGWWLTGLAKREISTRAELLFPLVRPFCMWQGNHLKQKYVRQAR